MLYSDHLRLNMYKILGYKVKEIVAEKYDSMEKEEKQKYLTGIILSE